MAKRKKDLDGLTSLTGLAFLVLFCIQQILSNPLFLLFTIGLIVSIIRIVNLPNRKILESGIEDIDKMSGIEFEVFLENLFKKRGFSVYRTRLTGDYGVDLIIKKQSLSIAIQAKRYKTNVGLSAIQEIVAGKLYYNCQKGLVITNSYFTKPATILATKTGVELWDRQKLINQILKK